MVRSGNWRRLVEELYRKHFDALHRMACRHLRDREQVRDAVQELFTKMLEEERRFDSTEDAVRFLYRSFKNLLIDRIRTHIRWKYRDLDDLQPEAMSTAPRQEEDLVRKRLRKKSLPLPQPDKGVFELAYFQHKSDQEIAALLELKISTVRYCLKKARRAISEILIDRQRYRPQDLAQFFSRAKN